MFKTVPEERFKNDVLKTWIAYFKNDPALSGVSVTSRRPDVDTTLKLPNILITRIGSESRDLMRLSGFHGYQPAEIPDATIGRLMGYTMNATYQIDIITKTIGDMNKYVGIVERKLKSSTSSDVFADLGGPVQTVIPVLDFVTPTDPEGEVTDLKIRFRYHRNVDCIENTAFDAELHQYTITVDFRVHYLKEYELPKINKIKMYETLY